MLHPRTPVAASFFEVLQDFSSSAQAHHGYATFFDPMDRTVAIEGGVERNAGVSKTTFTVGDHLIVIGALSRDPASRDVTLVREVRRARDQWNWRSRTPFAQPSM